MKFVSDKSSLQQSLQHLGRVIPTRSTLPILSSVLLSTEDGRLSLRATDLEISQVFNVTARVEKEGSIALPQRTLLEITSEIPEGEITIDVSEDLKVLISTSFGSYSIMGKPVDEFPSLPELDNKQALSFPSSLLDRLIEKTAFAASRDELKPSLLGVLFHIQESEILAVATDGHRLVRYLCTGYKGDSYQGDNIVPVKFMNIIKPHLVDDEEITLFMGDNHIMMETRETTIYSRIIDERFPEHESVFPKDSDKFLKIDCASFLSAVKRVSIFSNRTTRQIALRLGPDSIEITTEDVETVSSARETIPGEYRGEPLVIGYNSNYLLDLLSHIDSQTVHMELRSPVSAAIIYPDEQKENEELTMLLMPIRLND